MLKNYLKVAWRSLLRNRTFSVIDITGAAMANPVRSLKSE
jgi:hypothetical protein